MGEHACNTRNDRTSRYNSTQYFLLNSNLNFHTKRIYKPTISKNGALKFGSFHHVEPPQKKLLSKCHGGTSVLPVNLEIL